MMKLGVMMRMIPIWHLVDTTDEDDPDLAALVDTTDADDLQALEDDGELMLE